MYGVTDALTLDRKLIPLWQKIAAAADEQVRLEQEQMSPIRAPALDEDVNPWATASSHSVSPANGDFQTNPFRK